MYIYLTGWYTTDDRKQQIIQQPEICIFVVNQYYALVSSSISFWIPCAIMLYTYFQIFREANKQEQQLAQRQGTAMMMHRNTSSASNGKYILMN